MAYIGIKFHSRMSKKRILILGAGRSAYSLIEFWSANAKKNDVEVVVIDKDAKGTVKNLDAKNVKVVNGDLTDRDYRQDRIKESDIVISMLPVRFHLMVAEDCVHFKKHMVTASYASEDMESLHEEAREAGITIMNEVGLDPGIDHMSALKIIDEIRDSGAELLGFESFAGGLLAPEFEEDNPWQYKFTWNPRNVVLASSGSAVKFLDHGAYKYIPYHKVFRRTELINLDKYGRFEGYANRDSLKYKKLYGLDNVKTMYRGTFRRPGFCKAWDIFVQLGMTDDSYTMENSEELTYRMFLNSFLKYHPTDSVELKMMQYLGLSQDDIEIMEKLEWLDLFKPIKVGIKDATPAQILQHILMQKWTMEEHERDMIVMWHKFEYLKNGVQKELHSYMVYEGEDRYHTAMSKTVGIPVALTSEMILKGEFKKRGVYRPLEKEFYSHVLRRLKEYGIEFEERQIR